MIEVTHSFENKGMFISIYNGKPVLPLTVRDEVAVRELFAILQYVGKMPYQTLKSHTSVKPEFPDWILKDINTGKEYLADAKELAQEDDEGLVKYLKDNVRIIVCWKSRLSGKFVAKYPGLIVIEVADYFHDTTSFFREVILPRIKELMLQRFSDIKYSKMEKRSKGSEKRRNLRDLYVITMSRGQKEIKFRVYCDDKGLRWYGSHAAHEVMREWEIFAEKMADDLIRKLNV